MKLKSLIIVIILTFEILTSCQDEDERILGKAIELDESIEFGVRSIYLLSEFDNSITFQVNTQKSSFLGIYYRNDESTIAELNGITIKTSSHDNTIEKEGKVLRYTNYVEEYSTGNLTSEQKQTALILYSVLSDLEVSTVKFRGDISASVGIAQQCSSDPSEECGDPTETRCSANWSKKRANREIQESIEDDGGCQGDDKLATDCLCAIGDYGCFCCGECD